VERSTTVPGGTGGLEVQVLDGADKSSIPGAIVTLSHALGYVKEISLQTDSAGTVRFPVLPPGQGYRIRVVMSDYADYDSGNEVRVKDGASLVFQVPLLPTLREVVRVAGKTEMVDLAETGGTTALGGFIQDLPAPGRFYQKVLALAPGADDADGKGNPNVMGAREREFKANVSGVSNADPLTGGFAHPVAPDSIEEVEVVTSGAGVDYGGAQGGFANIVTVSSEASHEGPPEESSFAPSSEPGFALAAEQPTSTFGVDVDRASYALARRYLLEWGKRPPRDAVRLEEMVNYFAYGYPDPPRLAAMAVYVDDAAAPWALEHRLVRIGLQARRRDVKKLPPSTLVFLVDVSGSMEAPDRLPLVKAALAALTEELRPEDRVAVVTYANTAQVVLSPTSGDRKAEILDVLDDLDARGGTAGASGLDLAYQVAAKSRRPKDNARVILATDGDFNVGPSSDGEIVALIDGYRSQRIALSVLGVGSGEEFEDHRMEIIADRGDGNYAYADTVLEARRALVEEMGGTLTTVARDVKIQVTFDPSHVQAWRLLGYENRGLAREAFEKDAEDAGDMGAGHAVTAFYEVTPATAGGETITSPNWMTVEVRWQPAQGGPSELIQVPAELGQDTSSPDFRFASAVAEFALLLRESPHKGAASIDTALERARATLGKDEDGRRAELVALMEAYRTAR